MHPNLLPTYFALFLMTDHNNTKHHTEKSHAAKLHDFQHAMQVAQQKAKHGLICMLLLMEPDELNRQISLTNARKQNPWVWRILSHGKWSSTACGTSKTSKNTRWHSTSCAIVDQVAVQQLAAKHTTVGTDISSNEAERRAQQHQGRQNRAARACSQTCWSMNNLEAIKSLSLSFTHPL